MANNGSLISKQTIVHSIAWKFLERFCTQGVNFVIQIILARLLLPEIFGYLAVISAIVNYLGLFVQSGIATALVQKKDIDCKDINTVFTASLVVALIIYITIFILSYKISYFYNTDILVWPIRVLSLGLFFSSINAIQTALLSRKMQFKQMFVRSLVAIPISGFIGIIMAHKGFGIWALVAQNLINSGLTVIIFSFYSKHKFKLEFVWERAKVLYKFSINILISNLVSGFSDTLRSLLIGKKYSAIELAYYDKGYTYASYFTNIITGVISGVLLPTFSRSQDDITALQNRARRAVQLTGFIIIPFLTFISAVSDSLIIFFLSETWVNAVFFLKIFCLLRIPCCIVNVDRQVYFALGNSSINLKYELGLLITNVFILFITIPIGIKAIAYGYLITEYLGCFILMLISQRIYGYSLLMRIRDLFKPIVSSTLFYIILSLPIYNITSVLLTLILKSIIAIVCYYLFTTIMKDKTWIYIYTLFNNKINN